MKVLRLGHQLLRRVGEMVKESPWRDPARHQSHQKNGTNFPKNFLWPWRPYLPTQQASFGSPGFLGQEAKTRSKGFFSKRPLAGCAAFSGKMAWIGGL